MKDKGNRPMAPINYAKIVNDKKTKISDEVIVGTLSPYRIPIKSKKNKSKRTPPRMMTVLEARRMFISEVEEFFIEEYGNTMMHAQINLEDADAAFAEFVGLKREREERGVK